MRHFRIGNATAFPRLYRMKTLFHQIAIIALIITSGQPLYAQQKGWQRLISADSSYYVYADTLHNGALSPNMVRWLRYRPHPIIEPYHNGYQILNKANERYLERTSRQQEPRRLVTRAKQKYNVFNLLWGRSYDIHQTDWRIGVPGLMDLLPERNATDGLWMGLNTELSYRFAPGVRLAYHPDLYYTQLSDQWFTRHYLMLHYAPRSSAGLLLVGAGISSGDIHLETTRNIYLNEHPVGLVGNTAATGYRKTFAVVRNESFIGSLQLTLGGAWEQRTPYSFLRGALTEHQALTAQVEVLWHILPYFSHSTAGGAKYERDAGVIVPLIGLDYRRAFSFGSRPNMPTSDYSRMEWIVKGICLFEGKRHLHYQLTAGRYLHRTQVFMPDERFFNKVSWSTRNPMEYKFITLPSDYIGGNRWGTLHLTYYSSLHKKSDQRIFEPDKAFHLNAIWHPKGEKPFVEGGYSLGIGHDFMRLGIFLGYDAERSNWHPGLCLSVPLLRLIGTQTERE